MKHVRILSFLILSLIAHPSSSQVDTLFWFAAPEISNVYILDRPIYIRITAYAQPATVTISQPAGGGMPAQTVVVAANGTQSVDLTPWIDFIESKPPNIALNYGLKVVSTAPISAYYDMVSGGGINSTANPEVFSLKGKNALGTDFLIPSQNYIDNAGVYTPTPYNSFDIVATENNTSVTITPSSNITGHAAGSTFTVTLNAGQTWSGTATSVAAGQHLYGSRVISDKPVAITVKDDELVGTPFGGCADLAGDQIIPVPLLGREYIAMKGLLNNAGDQLFITALQNGTTITHNGALVTTINAGITHRLAVAAPSSYIQTNNPVSVWQLSGIGCEVGGCQLPQIECTGSASVSYTRATSADLYFNLLVRSGGQGDFLVNGATGLITAGQFTVVPNTGGNWYTAQITIPLGAYPQGSVINVSNTSSLFHLSVLEGGVTTGGASYGYFSNFSLVTADASAFSRQICDGDSIQLFANGIQGASYQWSGPGGFNSTQQNPVIANAGASHSGIYTLAVNLSGCGTSSDTVHVTVHEYPDADLGSDIELCADSVTLRPVNPPPAGSSYTWSTGAVTDFARVGRSDTYWLRVTHNGCTASDTVEVDLNGSLSVDLGPDVRICDRDTPYVLTSTQPAGAQYLWSNGWALPQMSVTRTGSYWLRVTHNGCEGSDTIIIEVVQKPEVFIGGPRVICASVPERIGTTVVGASYLWNTGSRESHIMVDQTGLYWLEVDIRGCKGSDTAYIVSMPDPVVDLGPDGHICTDEEILLDAGNPGYRYYWNTGSLAQILPVTTAGWYYVTVTSPDNCVGRDSILLTFLPDPVVALGADTAVCEETPLLLKPYVLNQETLLWSDGSNGNSLSIVYGGTYTVTAANECGMTSDTINVRRIFCDIWVPNVFTPNGDGRNDVYRVLGNLARVDGFGLSIFDRWGQRVFYTSDKYQGWDGLYNGAPSMMGTFVYMLEYQIEGRPILEKGNFHLIR